MAHCKIKVMVLMENVPEDKKKKLLAHIAESVKTYSDHLGCELDLSMLG